MPPQIQIHLDLIYTVTIRSFAWIHGTAYTIEIQSVDFRCPGVHTKTISNNNLPLTCVWANGVRISTFSLWTLCPRFGRIVLLQIADRALTVSDRIKIDVMWNMNSEISVPWAVRVPYGSNGNPPQTTSCKPNVWWFCFFLVIPFLTCFAEFDACVCVDFIRVYAPLTIIVLWAANNEMIYIHNLIGRSLVCKMCYFIHKLW